MLNIKAFGPAIKAITVCDIVFYHWGEKNVIKSGTVISVNAELTVGAHNDQHFIIHSSNVKTMLN